MLNTATQHTVLHSRVSFITLSVTHPNQTKPKNRGCNVHVIINVLMHAQFQVSKMQRGCADDTFCNCQCSEAHLLKHPVNVDLYWKHISVSMPLSCDPLLEVDDNSSRHRSSSPPLVLFWLVSWKGCWWSSQHGECCDQCHTEGSIMGSLLYLFAFCTLC